MVNTTAEETEFLRGGGGAGAAAGGGGGVRRAAAARAGVPLPTAARSPREVGHAFRLLLQPIIA